MDAPGLYLHIPFCSRICPYCDFAVLTGGPARRAAFVDSLLAEIALWRSEAERWNPFDTVYFGGGTPSALPAADFERLLAALHAALPLAPAAWIGLEVNPEDVTAESTRQWRQLGVSMLSLGVQSFDAAALRFLGRRHLPDQARRAVELALAAGFATVSVDLIYGIDEGALAAADAGQRRRRGGGPAEDETGQRQQPGGDLLAAATAGAFNPGMRRPGRDRQESADQPGAPASALARWPRDLEAVVALGPHHLSCYQLTIHEGTPFGFRAARGELQEMPNQAQAELFRFTHTFLAARGYAGYEVSNFARTAAHAAGDAPGRQHQSRHNRKYWNHTPYLGLGPSAHSFDGRRRWWNERKLGAYQKRLAAGERPIAGGEDLGRSELALEEVMLSLRTAAGLDLDGFRGRHGFDLAARNGRLIASLTASGLLAACDGRLVPTLDGLAIADSLVRSFDLGDAGGRGATVGEPDPTDRQKH